MITLSQLPGRTTIINEEEYLFFSGYSYLGLGLHKGFTNLVKEGIDKYGVVYPSSRISNTPLDLYTQFEEKLATFTNTEASACFSSGFLSARTAVEVVRAKMNVYSLIHTHPASSAFNGIQTIDQSKNWQHFLQERKENREFRFAIVADSIYPTPGQITDFSFLNQTSTDFNITLIIDDSHGIGWMGDDGKGIISHLSLPSNIKLLLNFSLSKAFHMNGGAICGSQSWIHEVKKHVNYTTSTPMMPSLAYAWLHADEIFKEQRTKLRQNIIYLQKLTSNFTFVNNGGTPVFVFNKQNLAGYLLQNKILISSFGYPQPEDDAVNRIVVNALHLKTDLEKVSELINRF
jgi:7-keto-8-aminopelargonate synthetase-like enzyme